MPTFTKKILGALGLKRSPPPKPKKPATSSKTGPPSSERAALIANAMALYRQNAAMMRGIIDGALKELRDKPPNLHDVDSVTRLLSLRRAELQMRKLMNHRDRRYLVLTGMRELLEQKPKVAPPGVKKLVVKR